MKTPVSGMRFGGNAGAWWPLLLAVACFVLARPYEGYVHDARLYVGFAVAPLDPGGIGADLLFQHDEQSGRSLYPAVLRALSAVWSPSVASLVLTGAALALWFAGLWRLLAVLFPDLPATGRAALTVLATTVDTFYGGSATFHFAEPFAAPRALAEALVLWGLTMALQRRWFACVALMTIALAVHPLMAAAGVALAVWLALPDDRWRTRSLLLATAAASGIVAATVVRPAESGVLRVFDADWLRVLRDMGSLAFLRHWEPIDWSRLVVHAGTLVMTWPILSGSARRVVVAAALTAGGGVMLTLCGADLAGSVLLTQSQPWRALWLFALIAAVGAGLLAERTVADAHAPYTSRSGYRRVAVLLLLVAWSMMATSTSASTLALLALALWWLPALRPTITLPPVVCTAVTVLIPVVLIAMVTVEAAIVWQVYVTAPESDALWHWPNAVQGGAMRLLGIGVAWYLLRAGSNARYARTGPLAAVALTLAAAWCVDARSTFERELERQLDARVSADPASRVRGLLASLPDGPVFWADGEMEAWAFFGRPSYATIIQGTPRVFGRALALQWADRWARVTALQSETRPSRYRLAPDRLYAEDPAGIREFCSTPDAPATVVLWARPAWAADARAVSLPAPQLLPGQDPGAAWEVRRTMYLVSCHSIRSTSAP